MLPAKDVDNSVKLMCFNRSMCIYLVKFAIIRASQININIMSAELNIAQKAVHQAGDAINQLRTRNELLSVNKKIANGFINKAAQASLNALYYTLNKAYPEDDIQTSDQSLTENTQAERTWQIIPLDGASNLLYDVAHCAIAVTMIQQGEVKLTMIYNPLNDDLLSASKGGGCFLNQRRVRLEKDNDESQIILATNKPDNNKGHAPHFVALKNIGKQVIDVRNMGCSLLDLGMVASAQIDGYWQADISPFAIDATALMIKESGGQCLDFAAGDAMKNKRQIIAANINNATWLAAQLKGIYQPA